MGSLRPECFPSGSSSSDAGILESFRRCYLWERLDGQIAHFREYGAKASRFEGRLSRIGETAAYVAPVCVGIVFLNKLFRYLGLGWPWQKTLIGAVAQSWHGCAESRPWVEPKGCPFRASAWPDRLEARSHNGNKPT